MEISIYSTIDFSKARNLLTERQKNIKAFNPIVPEGGCISLLELNPKQYISIYWYFINQKTGKITPTTAESSDGMHYVAIPEGLSLGTYRLKIESRRMDGNTIINETTISNPFEYVEASEDIVTIVSRNADNNLVGNLRKNATIIQPIYTNPSEGGVVVVTRSTAKLMKTGQTTSYRTGDDGDIEAGREVDFFTLAENNPFGNTNRFTDELGGQTYANNIVIDWSTYDGLTVLGWYRTAQLQTYANHLTNAAALTVGTFAIWKVPNLNELFSLRLNQPLCFNYAPLSVSLNTYFFTSTPNPQAPDQQMGISSIIGTVINLSEASRYAIYARDFTVNGITLT